MYLGIHSVLFHFAFSMNDDNEEDKYKDNKEEEEEGDNNDQSGDRSQP